MTFSIQPYLDLRRHPSVYGPVRVSKNASVYLPILLPKVPLCILSNFCSRAKISLWGCFSIHAYIWVSKNNLFYMPIFQSQKCPSVYAHVRVSTYASTYICLLQGYSSPNAKMPLCVWNYRVSKFTSQYVPILGFPKIPISIWLYMSLLICPICFSIYVNIRFSIHTPFYKLIFGC